MTWLQIDVLEMLFESARERLVELHRPIESRAMSSEEARAAYRAARHLDKIRVPHPLSSSAARTFNCLI